MWFFFALITVVVWGAADLFYKLGSPPSDRYSHLRIVIVVGVVMGAHALFQLFAEGVAYDYFNIIRYLPVSLCYILSMAIGYFGLRYIELSVSSPVSNSSGAVASLLCVIFLNQTATALQFAAVGVICAGIILLAAFDRKKRTGELAAAGQKPDKKLTVSAVAIMFPILYCVIDGVGTFADAFYLDRVMSETDANISYELTFLAAAAVALVWLLAVRRQRLEVKRLGPAVIAAAFETGGQFFYIRAMSRNAVLAAPLVACYSIVSVLLSRLFLKEKLTKAQYAVILFILAAIAVLGME